MSANLSLAFGEIVAPDRKIETALAHFDQLAGATPPSNGFRPAKPRWLPCPRKSRRPSLGLTGAIHLAMAWRAHPTAFERWPILPR